MKKVLALILALVLALSCMAAFAEEEVIKLGMASNANDENMNVQMQNFEKYCEDWNAAGNTPKLEACITVADASVDKQLSDVDSLIELGCAAIYLHSVDLEGLKPAVDACNAAGVKVMEARGMQYDKIDCVYTGADEYTMAEMAFKWYDKLLTENPDLTLKMGLIYGLAAQSAQLIRVDHCVSLLQEKYGDRIEVLASMPCDWDAQKAMECMENWYQRFAGEMNCIIAAGAMMACGAAQALIGAAEDMDNWVITTTDATSDVLYAINEGQVDMTVGIDAAVEGYGAAEQLHKVATGEYTEKSYAVGDKILASIDSSNIADWYKG